MVGKQLIDVDAEIGNIATEGPEPDPRVGVVVALAKLEEAPERSYDLDAPLHRFAGQRVQYHVDALAAGYRAHVIDEVEVARGKYVVSAEHPQEVAFFLRTRGRNRARASPTGDLKCGQAHASGATMNKQPLPAGQPSQVVQRVIGRQKGDRNCGASLERESSGQRRNGGLRCDDTRRKGARRERDDTIAALYAANSRAHGDHRSGPFDAKCGTREAVLECFFRQQAQRPHHVTEIEASGHDVDRDLSGARCDQWFLDPVDTVDAGAAG